MLLFQLIIVILVFIAMISLLLPNKKVKDALKLTLTMNVKSNDVAVSKKARRNEILKQKPGRFKKLIMNIKITLIEFKFINTTTFLVAVCIFFVVGFAIGQMWNNFIASLLLAGVGSFCPYLLLRFLISKKKRETDEKILVVMGDIQAELVQTKDFIKSVKNKLPEIKRTSPVLYEHFKWFTDMILFLTPKDNIQYMEELAERIDNYFFSLYMKYVISFEKGQSSLVYTAQSIPSEYRSYLGRLKKYQRIVSGYNKDFFTKIICLPILIGFLKITSEDFYNILTHNFFGQATLVIVLISFIIGAILFSKYNKDIKLED